MVKTDYFLSEIFQKKCGTINIEKDFNIENLKNYYFISSKSKVSTDIFQRAINLNFYFVQISISFERKLNYEDIHVTPFEFANNSDLSQLGSIAFKSFFFDRFHKDNNIPNEIASEIKRKWIENFFKEKRGDKCFVSKDHDGSIKGFLLTKKVDDEIIIDLISVAENYRRKGVAKSLINSMFNYYHKNYKNFIVSTQLENTNSIHLYKSLEFRIKNYFIIWHYINKR